MINLYIIIFQPLNKIHFSNLSFLIFCQCLRYFLFLPWSKRTFVCYVCVMAAIVVWLDVSWFARGVKTVVAACNMTEYWIHATAQCQWLISLRSRSIVTFFPHQFMKLICLNTCLLKIGHKFGLRYFSFVILIKLIVTLWPNISGSIVYIIALSYFLNDWILDFALYLSEFSFLHCFLFLIKIYKYNK